MTPNILTVFFPFPHWHIVLSLQHVLNFLMLTDEYLFSYIHFISPQYGFLHVIMWIYEDITNTYIYFCLYSDL